MFLFKVLEKTAEQVSDRVIDAEVNCEICERKMGRSTDQKIGACILLWHSNIVIIYYFLLFYC